MNGSICQCMGLLRVVLWSAEVIPRPDPGSKVITREAVAGSLGNAEVFAVESMLAQRARACRAESTKMEAPCGARKNSACHSVGVTFSTFATHATPALRADLALSAEG